MNLSPLLRQRFFDASGLPLAGGLLYSYVAGSSTPLVTYSNQAGSTNTNPVVLDTYGYCDVWINPSLSYKFVLEDSLNNILWTVDNVNVISTQAANLVYAGPASGAAAIPTFRTLVTPDMSLSVVTKTANYQATILDDVILLNTNAFTVTLPAANAMTMKVLRIVNIDSANHTMTISRAGSDTIEGSTSVTLLNQYDEIVLWSDGSATWYIQSFKKAPVPQNFTSTGTQTGILFTISTSTTCAVGDTYTTNANTYTVLAALAATSGQVLFMSGTGSPTASGQSGTLVRATGSGTSSVSFTAWQTMASYTPTAGVRYIRVKALGAGGGGAGSSSGTGGNGTDGGTTTFGTNLLIANGGAGQIFNNAAVAGGTVTVNSPASQLIALRGASGGAGVTGIFVGSGGGGGVSPLGGAGAGGINGSAGTAAIANSGSGGGGAGGTTSVAGQCGGAAGGYIEASLNPAVYYYSVGASGAFGAAGVAGFNGGAGSVGFVGVTEFFQ